MFLYPNKKVYFLSDFHLGSPSYAESIQREKKIVSFLYSIKENADSIYIVGDIFDFWFEYKTVVPKGFIRLLGTLSSLADYGVKIQIFLGNHDLWLKDYLPNEFNVKIYSQPQIFIINGYKFYVAHGDGLGKGDSKYKFLKSIFTNKFNQKLFRLIHPDYGIKLANYFSRLSRKKNKNAQFLGAENEWLIEYSKDILLKEFYHFFIFGHRHYPVDYALTNNSRYINLGDWVSHFSFAVFDGQNLEIQFFD